jgi:aminopeptidase N
MSRIRGAKPALVLSAFLAAVWAPAGAQQPAGERRQVFPPPGASSAAEAKAAPASEPLRTAVDRPIDVRDIRLDLAVDLPKKTVEGTATLQLRSLRPVKHIELDAVAFQVKKVTLASGGGSPQPAAFSHDGKKLKVLLESPWQAGQEATLTVEYHIHEPKAGLHFFGPTADDPKAPLCVWSQGQPVGNRSWIPCVDEPDQRQTTQMVVTVPEGYEVISNGTLVDRKTNADKTVTFNWRQDKPHPSYLVTLVVGPFDVVREEWDGLPVLYYVPRGHKDHVAATFGRTRDMLAFFSKRFGIHYPWDKYAQVVAYRFGGGMENTSATTMGDIMHDERSALDRNSDGIISHELAHQWWGDLVTCRDWSHLWLNEGFASYAEALWDEHARGGDDYAYNMHQKAAGAIRDGKSRPVVDRHYPDPSAMFDGRSYPKGAWILHMLRRRLGDDAFWQGVQKYGSEHRLQSAETADFRRTLERVSGRNLERFFYDWTERPGSPVVEVATEYLPATQQARVSVKQTQSGEPFHFPFTMLIHCAGASSPVPVQQDVTDKEYTFLVPLPGPPTLVEVDPEQTLLGEIKEVQGRDLWVAQLSAPGVATRLRAVQHFRESKSPEDREVLAAALGRAKFWGVQSEIAAALAVQGGDRAREALLEGIHSANPRVRRACMEALGKLPANRQVAEAAARVLHDGEPSYAVCGAAMTTLARHRGKDAVGVLSAWLSRPSYNDTLRASALTALGYTGDATVLEVLLDSTKPPAPRATRAAALRGLIQLAGKIKPNDEQRKRVLAELTSVLEGDDFRAQFAILSAVGELGTLGPALLPAVEKVVSNAPNERLRGLARRSAESLRTQAKADSSGASDEVRLLREKVQRLEREQAELKERLRRLEKTGSRQ